MTIVAGGGVAHFSKEAAMSEIILSVALFAVPLAHSLICIQSSHPPPLVLASYSWLLKWAEV
eukprot:999576-Pyramimonas_sp.AAC.1